MLNNLWIGLMLQLNTLILKREDQKKVRYAATRLKGHAAIWWDELQIHR